jgi:hypothetical protein
VGALTAIPPTCESRSDLGKEDDSYLGGLVSASALDKVLNFAQPGTPEPDAADMVRAAVAGLEQLSLILAGSSKGDGDSPPWPKKGKGKPMPKGKKKSKASDSDDDDDDDGDDDDEDDDDVSTCRSLVLQSMVALSHVQGGEVVSLSVLTAAERREPSAHTIPGSEDYPIPDKVHLAAAVARYKQGKFAGHSAEEVARHIRSRAKALGEQVDLTAPSAAGVVLALAKGGFNGPKYPASNHMVPMEHGPFHGMHSHPHRVGEVHEHDHYHNGDSRHNCGVSPYQDY